jgi:hypothetical protein
LTLSLDEAFVLPDSLTEESGPLEEATTGFDGDERNIVVVDGQDAAEKKPAAEQTLARLPGREEVGGISGERHPEEGPELAVDTCGACRVAPDRLGGCTKIR